MGRKSIPAHKKSKSVGVSLPPHQIIFIKNHDDFDISKFVQIHLEGHIQTCLELERRDM